MAPIPKATPIQSGGRPPVSVYPASRSQVRMWFIYLLAPDSPVYSIPSAWHLQGPLNLPHLESALTAVVRRHDALRTTFAMDERGVVQRIAAHPEVVLEYHDFSPIAAPGNQDAGNRLLSRQVVQPFNLETGRPFRVILVRLSPEDHRLLLLMHHIVGDGWSRQNLLRDLSMSYAALAAGRPGDLAPLPIQPADIAAWQERRIATDHPDRNEAYWISALAGDLTPLDLPADHPRPAMITYRGDCRFRPLDPLLRERMECRAAEEGATLFMILLMSFGILLRRKTGRTDPIVGTPVSGRTRVEMEPLVGYFANTLPLRLAISHDLSARELLRRVRETVLQAQTHQEVPFERLIEQLQVPRDPARHSLVSVCFRLIESASPVLQLPGAAATECDLHTGSSKFDLTFTADVSGSRWRAMAEYSTDLFDAHRVDGWLSDWEQLLEHIASNPDQPVRD